MNSRTLLSSLALSSVLMSSLPAAAAPANPPREQAPSTPEAALAAKIGEIVATPSLSPKQREEMIAAAVRLAIATAIDGVSDPAQVLKVALQFTTLAVKAAPGFSEAIQRSTSDIPALASIPGGLAQIQAAVLDTVMAAGGNNNTPPVGRGRGNPPTNPGYQGKKDDIPVSPGH